jgi:hypothetical protein
MFPPSCRALAAGTRGQMRDGCAFAAEPLHNVLLPTSDEAKQPERNVSKASAVLGTYRTLCAHAGLQTPPRLLSDWSAYRKRIVSSTPSPALRGPLRRTRSSEIITYRCIGRELAQGLWTEC